MYIKIEYKICKKKDEKHLCYCTDTENVNRMTSVRKGVQNSKDLLGCSFGTLY